MHVQEIAGHVNLYLSISLYIHTGSDPCMPMHDTLQSCAKAAADKRWSENGFFRKQIDNASSADPSRTSQASGSLGVPAGPAEGSRVQL